MGITHGVLFPDYAGAVDICKDEIKKEKRLYEERVKKNTKI